MSWRYPLSLVSTLRRRPLNRVALLRNWRTRAVFWCGAIGVGLLAVSFAQACSWAIDWHAQLVASWPVVSCTCAACRRASCVSDRPVRSLAWRSWSSAASVVAGPGSGVANAGSRGSGIPQAIAALDAAEPGPRSQLLSLRIAFSKILLTVAGLLFGASIGREGPTVHVGASLMDALGRVAQFPFDYVRRSLILAGSAAGLSAAFNTPIAGIVFAIEEMSRSLEDRTTGTLITAVIVAGVVATGLLGDYTYFGVVKAQLPSARSWIAVLLCGLGGGLAGGLFSWALIDGSRRLAPYSASRPYATAFALGLLVTLFALLSGGDTYGTGYEQTRNLLSGDSQSGMLFPLFKWMATLASYLTGAPGGIFSSSLSTGGALGADLSYLVPQAPLSAMIILGMAGYFTGVTQSPLTGSVIVMEMVDGHTLILPILATSFLALGVSRAVCKVPVYRALAEPFKANAATPAQKGL